MLPPIEFSIGSTPYCAGPCSTLSKTSSKALHGTIVASPLTSLDAASLNAPGSPWYAIFIVVNRRSSVAYAKKGHHPLADDGPWCFVSGLTSSADPLSADDDKGN